MEGSYLRHQLTAGVWRCGSGRILEVEKLQREEEGRGQDHITEDSGEQKEE